MSYENLSVEELEAKIQEGSNLRDALNADLLELNHARDRRVKLDGKLKALEQFEKEHGPITQVIKADSVVSATKNGSLFDSIKSLIGIK